MDSVVYHSPLKLTPRQRLSRILAGLLWELKQKYPLWTDDELRTGLGLALCGNQQKLVEMASQLS